MAITSAPVTANGGRHSTVSLVQQLSKDHDLALRTFRMLIADLCQVFGAITFEQLKPYQSDRVDALCPGHPEIEHEGIEVTTGPLGQGVANAVGLAMATEDLAATYNRPGYEVVSNHTWCMVGDACLQEGVALKVVSFAGHPKLSNLSVIYDNNQITCDGSVDLTNTEDVNAKTRACGWDVVDVQDGCYDVEGVVRALERVLIVFIVGEAVRNYFHDLPARGEGYVREWNELVKRYTTEYPELGEEFQRRLHGLVFNPIGKELTSFMVGTADLSPSVNMTWPGKVDFQHPKLRTTCGINGNYSGRYIHYGVRGHAMCAISNGLAAFGPNTFIPVTSSFFIFYLYAAPVVRMGSLQHQVIHAATDDSIGMGEDGPTHQPVELASLYRAMPNLLYIRLGDSEETAGAWITAIEARTTSTIISTSRHALPQLNQTRREGVARGAYVLEVAEGADVTLIGVGAELTFALDQPVKYKRGVLQHHRGIPAAVIEPYAPNGWERYADAGICVRRFGHSLPGKAAYKFFGYDIDVMTGKFVDL
ncbi:uncharacterized protein P174DRAFT_455023 [Aspergillus novofumigatus IBT 16806]|uniref:Transketolase-like pyrimidine-binding domain-containing protein n=1 Tax=Aspergillus novofumigatus (strain IBT 16806) TaxID=1392255 RepID=A0A2I1BVE4_ASPN1|nr:uncharacterized protein P174DRAFT_455023 [Aspergillus novofumigatus IBT 16806]PKX89360.1 hypothetical protein P174DRAFT_455023 [Aspergillus novofumigatus IBT 16806]